MWTDRIGFCAALETIKKMERINLQDSLILKGIKIKKKWAEIAKKNNIKIEINGIDSMPSFKFKSKNSERAITYFTQEMLSLGFLASSSFALCYSHNDKIIKEYLDACEKIFKKIAIFLNNKDKIPLKSIVRNLNFKRLN